MREAGVFITLEGGEGCGKTTQARLLGEKLASLGIPVLATREPGGAPTAEKIRETILSTDGLHPVAEMLLFLAARKEHYEKTLKPALKLGKWVVCDRFSDSTRAYQACAAGVGEAFFDMLSHASLGQFAPHLTIILDIPVEAGLRRTKTRQGGHTRFEEKAVSFHEKVRQGFLSIARREPARCIVVDASADPATVHKHVWAALEARLGSFLREAA